MKQWSEMFYVDSKVNDIKSIFSIDSTVWALFHYAKPD